MDIRLLRYFAVLADELHFGRAAARLHISQPPLSQQIRILEEEMGTALFLRSQHRVELTEAGKTLKEQVPLIFAQFERAIDLTRCAGRGEVGSLEIGIISSAMVEPIPCALKVFAQKHPHVHWTLHEMTPASQILALKERRLDVCFFRVSHEDPDVRSEVVMRESAVAALPVGHRLAAREEIALRELETEHFVSFG
jgi:DNA-binding transcriptional LysR family regulator